MARDIFAILKRDHREVMDLFKKAERADDPEVRGEVFEQLRIELEAHSEAEKEVLYSRLLDEELTRSNVLEAEQEHHVVSTLLRELGRMKPDSERFAAKLHVLREMFRHHVDEEENDLFPKAKQVVEGNELKQMADRFEARKQALSS